MPGRMQRIECGQRFGVFVDYAHTADALATVLKTLQSVSEGRVICVFGAGGDRDRDKRPQMGRVVERWADVAVLTNDNPRREDPTRIANDVLRGFRSGANVIVEADRAEGDRNGAGDGRAGRFRVDRRQGSRTVSDRWRQSLLL